MEYNTDTINKNMKAKCSFFNGVIPKPPEPSHEKEIMSQWKENASEPLVSIVCHTYNHENFIELTLNGFLTQVTDFPFQIIINDDASTDNTQAIIQKYKARYPNIITSILQDENQFSKGVSPRNFTFPKVLGKYIALCEGDDYWISQSKLSKQVDAFTDGVSLVFHDALRISENRVINCSYYKNDSVPVKGYNERQMARGCKIPTASSMFVAYPFKKENHENIVNGDHLIWATMAGIGHAKYINEVMSVYRHHEGGAWSARKIKDKVAPALKSKRVIFDSVGSELKTAVLVGFLGTVGELSKVLFDAQEYNDSKKLLLQGYKSSYRMIIECRFYFFYNLKDALRVFRLLFFSMPKLYLRALRKTGFISFNSFKR